LSVTTAVPGAGVPGQPPQRGLRSPSRSPPKLASNVASKAAFRKLQPAALAGMERRFGTALCAVALVAVLYGCAGAPHRDAAGGPAASGRAAAGPGPASAGAASAGPLDPCGLAT